MKIIKISESDLTKIISKVIKEQGQAHWEDGNWIPAQAPTQNIGKNFAKFPCVTKFVGYQKDTNGFPTVFTQSLGQGGESKLYYPDGTVMWIDGSGKKTKSTYSCQGTKVIDQFIKNSAFKTYNGNPFVTNQSGIFLPKQLTDNGSNEKYVTQLQQGLIQKGYLNIPKPTGNYGRMTQSAVLLAAKNMDPGNESNQVYGVRKDLFDKIVNPNIKDTPASPLPKATPSQYRKVPGAGNTTGL
jgi:hypothetical protein